MDEILKKIIIKGIIGTIVMVLVIIGVSFTLSSMLDISVKNIIFAIIIAFGFIIALLESGLIYRVYERVRG